GTYDGGTDLARSFLKFDVSKFAGKHITDTNLALYNYYSSTCATDGSGTTVRRITSDWSSTSVTWNTRPSSTGTGAVNNQVPRGNSSACPGGWSTWDIDNIVQAWADGTPNYGLMVYGTNETDSKTWRRFRSANYTTPGFAPKLTVTYNSYPSTPTSAGVSPSAVNAYSGKRYVTTYTPTLSAKVSDPDGSTVKAQFEITNDPAYTGETPYSYTATSASVSSGGTATLAIPSANQLAGAHLRMRVRGYDGTDYGAWSSYVNFVPNVAKPNPPTISCSPYSSGSWTDKAANGATCTLSTSSTDGAGYQWGLDDKSLPGRALDTTDGNGGESQTITVNPGNGWHTLYARTIDSGGNISTATTSYAFGVGKAGLTSPVTGDTTDDDVTLSATQSGAFTGMTYQYRIGDSVGWQPIPVTYVTKSDGSAISSWPVSFSSSANPGDLTWAATSQLADDGPVQVRALFTDGTNTYGTDSATVTLGGKADNAPPVNVGPGAVNLLTGDYGLSATDASDFGAIASRSFSSRAPQAAAHQVGQVAIYGPNWISGITAATSDWSYIKETSSTSVSLIDASGKSTGFSLSSNGSWASQTGSEEYTLAGTVSGSSFTLTDSDGTKATFSKVSGMAPTWQLATSYAVSDDPANTTTVVSQAVTRSDGAVLAEPKYVIAPSSAVPASACASDPSTKGCRVLEFVYASSTTATSSAAGDYTGQVKQLKLWATEAGGSAATSTTVESYDYNAGGQLADAWDPRISPALKTSYTYDSAGRVVTETDPGQLPWTFAYDTVGSNGDAGDGMLVSASRPTLKAGTTSTTDGGKATTSVVYDVPVTGSSAPNALGASTTATWGQTDNPTHGTAVFPADSVPSSHNGASLGSGDYDKATIVYLDTSGREVNTANPGGHITTTEYDDKGNVTRELTAANRELALGTATSSDPLLAGAIANANSTADAADLLATVTHYTTGTDGATLLSDVSGPLHTVTLKHALSGGTSAADLAAGAEVLARQKTGDSYDEDRPSTAHVSDMLTSTTTAAVVDGYPSDADQQKTASTYDWTTGLQLTSVVDPSGRAITTTYTYDSDGNLASQAKSTSSGSATGTTVNTYWSGSGSGTCKGRPEWADLLCTSAPAGDITGGGSNPSQLVTKAYTYDRYGSVATLTETANGATRTTTTTHDDAERITKVDITGGSGSGTPSTTYTYDSGTGAVASVTSNGDTTTATYDELGRQTSYDDGTGNTSTTVFDSQDRPLTVTDSAPSTTTYTYDSTTGLSKTATDSVAGTFTATGYDADGNLTGEKLPGGYTLTQRFDPAGERTDRLYANSSGTTVLDDSADYAVTGEQIGHAENNGSMTTSTYSYDAAGRLTQAQDDTGSACTTRSYGFDGNTGFNRTSLATATSTADCADTTSSTTTTTTTTHTYDSADRISDSGYTYDAFGRTTAMPSGATLAYYNNDLLRQETTGTTQQTWSLDAAHRLASWTTQTLSGGTWSTTSSGINHYGDDSDDPTWTSEFGGAVSRNVLDLNGDLAATTTATGGTTLQLSNLHGDNAVQLDISSTTATAHNYDEFGNTTGTSRYGWLGSDQRSSETPTGLTLMGVRVYDPTTGRFLQADPVAGGSANAYEYAAQDPVNDFDLNGKWCIGPKVVCHPITWLKDHIKHYISQLYHTFDSWQNFADTLDGIGSFLTSGLLEFCDFCGAVGFIMQGAAALIYAVHRKKSATFKTVAGIIVTMLVSAMLSGLVGGAGAKTFERIMIGVHRYLVRVVGYSIAKYMCGFSFGCS
ncbi:DNRLRE domain-containing protein, partial [Streptomyces graminilatus]|uniref:DNRLRE domain-containing protein n=1 Tax=Streptomyces graminilatus TaxID=1464070 RepID=UPI0006E31B42